MTRFIFITGGVVSSLGKGIASAALGALLQEQGYRVRLRKLDPYLNIDPGTMSPTQHGEVFVTDDGAETDLDLGHYERFTGVPALLSDNVTSGKIYSEVIARERRGDFGGQTVQVIPHVTDAIKEFITAELEGIDFALIEIGGTVGDIESLPFLESIRQMGNELGRERCVFVHLTLVPYISSAGEVKTKPTQHSVKELQSVGIQPDILLCRCDRPISSEALRKIALFCNIRPDSVVAAMDVDTIYQVPISYHESGFDRAVLQHFGLDKGLEPPLDRWRDIVHRSRYPEGEVTVAVVGKYTNLADSYKSLVEALNHGGLSNRFKVSLDWVEAEQLEAAGDASSEYLVERLGHVDAILVPGGFGQRGSIGKIRAVQFAREKNIPFLGICFGMQPGDDRGQSAPCGYAAGFIFGIWPDDRAGGRAPDRMAARQPTGAAHRGGESRRHHAAGELPLCAEARQSGQCDLWRSSRDQRAAPPSLRGQPYLYSAVGESGFCLLGHVAGRRSA